MIARNTTSPDLMLDLLSRSVCYNPITGDFSWIEKPLCMPDPARWNSRRVGKSCGSLDGKGYCCISFRINGVLKRFRNHRLAWLLVHRCWPDDEIDHINQNRQDNRIENLRDVSKSVNLRNSRLKTNNTSGFNGVTRSKGDFWIAQANINHRRVYLGSFSSRIEAANAAKEYRDSIGFSPLHGQQKIT